VKSSNSGSGDWSARHKKNVVTLAYWTLAWLVTMAVAVFGPKFVWNFAAVPTILAIVVNLLAGVGMIIANKNHLQGLDELQQRIQLEAMALALGVALIVGLAYSTMDITNLIQYDAEISHLVILTSLTYLAGVLVGRRKYQ